jgi:hypothetical protein
MNNFFMKMREEINHRGAIGEIKLAPSCMHLYMYYLYHCHEGNCRRKEPFAKVMDPEGYQ